MSVSFRLFKVVSLLTLLACVQAFPIMAEETRLGYKVNDELFELLRKERSNPRYDIRMLKALLDKGADPNATDEEGNTPLHLAASQHLPPALDLLLARGAKLNVPNNDGTTPLMIMGRPSFFGFGTPPNLMKSAKMVHEKLLQILRDPAQRIKLGLSQQDKKGNTLLHQLIGNHLMEAAELTVAAGADLDLPNLSGETPALIAAQVRSSEEQKLSLLKMLIQKGADFKAKNNEGKTALSLVPTEMVGELFLALADFQGREEALQAMMSDPVIQVEYEKPKISMMINDPAISCPILEEEARKMVQWKVRTDGVDTTSSIKCACDEDKCSVSLTEISPDFMRKFMGKKSHCDGPNCFNTAMAANKNLQDIRHVGADEVMSFLGSSLCREKAREEEMRPGDLIVIHHKAVSFGDLVSDGPVHGFTYISDRFSFSKDSFSKEDGYLYTSTQDVFGKFNVVRELQRMSSESVKNGGDLMGKVPFNEVRKLSGIRYAIVYECQGGLFPTLQDQELSALNRRLEKSLCEAGQSVFHRDPSPEQVERWSSEVAEVLTLLDQSGRGNHPESGLIRARASSLNDQVDILRGKTGGPF